MTHSDLLCTHRLLKRCTATVSVFMISVSDFLSLVWEGKSSLFLWELITTSLIEEDSLCVSVRVELSFLIFLWNLCSIFCVQSSFVVIVHWCFFCCFASVFRHITFDIGKLVKQQLPWEKKGIASYSWGNAVWHCVLFIASQNIFRKKAISTK